MADFTAVQRESTVVLPANQGSKLPVTLPQMYTNPIDATGSFFTPTTVMQNTTLHVVPYIPYSDPGVQIVFLAQRTLTDPNGGAFTFTTSIVISNEMFYTFDDAPEGIVLTGSSTTSTALVDVRLPLNTFVSSPLQLVYIWPLVVLADAGTVFSQPSVKLTSNTKLGLTPSSVPRITVTPKIRADTYT